jgi:hypothetical protein
MYIKKSVERVPCILATQQVYGRTENGAHFGVTHIDITLLQIFPSKFNGRKYPLQHE